MLRGKPEPNLGRPGAWQKARLRRAQAVLASELEEESELELLDESEPEEEEEEEEEDEEPRLSFL